jgi:predicted dehydrogenase
MAPDRHLQGSPDTVTLMTLDPGHFHAALLQKTMYDQVSPKVYVFAPEGPDLRQHLQRIEQFNTRPERPTCWHQVVYSGPDYLEAMLRRPPGNVVVIAGINSRKTAYVKAAVDAGLNVLADKPMCIDQPGWQVLKAASQAAQDQGILLSDIMTSRHEITHVLSRELVHNPAVFGTLQHGTPDEPAVIKESVHHLCKYVAGRALERPAWYFDVTQQGEGIVDITTHLVDQVMWECFSEQAIDYTTDVNAVHGRRWPTMLTRDQLVRVTGSRDLPPALQEQMDEYGVLPYSCNGEIRYILKGVHVRIVVQWDFEAPAGGGDTHASVLRGTLSTIRIRQGKAQWYQPELYVEPIASTSTGTVERGLRQAIETLQTRYPGVGLQQDDAEWHVTIPEVYRIGHEAHFGRVTETYLQYLHDGQLPAWEVSNLLAKYYTTTRALAVARGELAAYQ